MPSSHLILCRPLVLLPPIPPSIRVFSNESTFRMRWPKYWGFSFSISPSNEHPGLISFRMDWLDLLAVQGTLKSLLQHHSSKASILRHSAFFTVQLSRPYMTTGKTIALTRRTFVGKVMSLLFNILSTLVVTFLPRSKRLSISWRAGCGGTRRSEAVRSYPSPKVRGSHREHQAATAQERRPRGATPPPRSSCCMGAGRPRGATPRSRSGGAAMRRSPSSKVRSSGCALLEQP